MRRVVFGDKEAPQDFWQQGPAGNLQDTVRRSSSVVNWQGHHALRSEALPAARRSQRGGVALRVVHERWDASRTRLPLWPLVSPSRPFHSIRSVRSREQVRAGPGLAVRAAFSTVRLSAALRLPFFHPPPPQTIATAAVTPDHEPRGRPGRLARFTCRRPPRESSYWKLCVGFLVLALS